ncbi:MAG: hypothetical protein NEHIOOID_01073 [Holosporales bacterium]
MLYPRVESAVSFTKSLVIFIDVAVGFVLLVLYAVFSVPGVPVPVGAVYQKDVVIGDVPSKFVNVPGLLALMIIPLLSVGFIWFISVLFALS